MQRSEYKTEFKSVNVRESTKQSLDEIALELGYHRRKRMTLDDVVSWLIDYYRQTTKENVEV